jgi:hypothetical protein
MSHSRNPNKQAKFLGNSRRFSRLGHAVGDPAHHRILLFDA